MVLPAVLAGFVGLKFKRQKSVGNYIVDFFYFSPTLIVEVDGGSMPTRGIRLSNPQNCIFQHKR